jgi:hypothetical protein
MYFKIKQSGFLDWKKKYLLVYRVLIYKQVNTAFFCRKKGLGF